VWLRHLVKLYENDLKQHPEAVLELGPGTSLGAGFASLLTGTNRYYALDSIKYAEDEQDINVFYEIIEMLKRHEPIPNQNEFPKLFPFLKSYDFPHHIFDKKPLAKSLDKDRIKKIENAIKNIGGLSQNQDEIDVKYIAPWDHIDFSQSNCINVIFSQAVMEHIINIDFTYMKMYKLLKTGGYMSHAIDYKAHGTHNHWNGHWTINRLFWKIMMKTKDYQINRYPFSEHVKAIGKHNFKILSQESIQNQSNISKQKIRIKNIKFQPEDFNISSAHIIARK
tara:strand:+ start:2841 stop:3680 length:840 start_codon:yes stop_codon:yes gene_type:complete